MNLFYLHKLFYYKICLNSIRSTRTTLILFSQKLTNCYQICKIFQQVITFDYSLDKFDSVCKDVEINLKEAERMLKQMDLEITTNSAIERGKGGKNYQFYKKRFDEFKGKFFKSKDDYTYTKKLEEMRVTQRDIEIKEDCSINSKLELKQRQTTGEMEEIELKSSAKLGNVIRTALEAENISKNVMVDLESQTNLLKSTGVKVVALNGSLENSGSVITSIINRENRSKTILGIFSITLLSIFVVMMFSRYNN